MRMKVYKNLTGLSMSAPRRLREEILAESNLRILWFSKWTILKQKEQQHSTWKRKLINRDCCVDRTEILVLQIQKEILRPPRRTKGIFVLPEGRKKSQHKQQKTKRQWRRYDTVLGILIQLNTN